MDAKNKNSHFQMILQKIDPTLILFDTRELKGGVSAQVTLLQAALPNGEQHSFVIRLYGDVDLKRNPSIASDEFRLLSLLREQGMSVPKPYLYDQTCSIIEKPYILVEYIEGEPLFISTNTMNIVEQLAVQLSKIHNVNSATINLSVLPQLQEQYTKLLQNKPLVLDEMMREGSIRHELEKVWPLPKRNENVLLHGDYWPGNTLWKDDLLISVIDWEDAMVGDPLADYANARLEILWAFGMGALNAFTKKYKALMPKLDYSDLPYWDLFAALKPASKISLWGLEETKEKEMRERHHVFMTNAFEEIKKIL